MGSRWKLGRAGAALAVTAAMVGTAALPAAAEAARGRLTDDKTEGWALNIIGQDEGPLQASLLHLKLADGTVLKMYCVEIEVGATDKRDMVEVPWDSYPNPDSPFHDNRGYLKWVLQHGYPAKSLDELKKLDLDWSEDGLEVEEAVSATQAAVWFFSDGAALDEDDPSTRNDAEQDILALYRYLVDEAENASAQPTPVLEINPAEVEGDAGTLVGPFTVTTNGAITKIDENLPEGVVLADGDGNELDAEDITDGSEVFLKVPADAEAGDGSFSLTTKSRVDIGRLFVVDGYHDKGKGQGPAQSLIVAESGETTVAAEAKGLWKLAPTTPPTTTSATTAPPTTTTETTAPPVTTTTPVGTAPSSGELPNTGASILLPALIGLGLVAAGATALIVIRRRRSAA